MGITWDEAAKDRLLAAVLATMDKVDNKELARLFGGEATVSAIENHLRGPKKLAAALKAEAADADAAGVVIPASTPRKNKGDAAQTPTKKAGDKTGGVKSGRVAKPKNPPTSAPASPTKARKPAPVNVKTEAPPSPSSSHEEEKEEQSVSDGNEMI